MSKHNKGNKHTPRIGHNKKGPGRKHIQGQRTTLKRLAAKGSNG